MARSVSSFDELERLINKQINDSLNSVEVEGIFQDAMAEAVEEEVYEAYEPTVYERREDQGGLSDPGNMSFTDFEYNKKQGFSLDFENLTKGRDSMKGQYISELIEKGSDKSTTGHWKTEGEWSEPRAFAEKTAEKLNGKTEHNKRLKQTLQKQINRT